MNAVHGGDLQAVAERYGVDASTLVDFSANIAPQGPPSGVARVLARAASKPRLLAPYPSSRYGRLRAQIAASLDVDRESVVVGNGSAALIDLALRANEALAWLVPVPAFSEYRRSLDAANVAMLRFALPQTLALDVDAFLSVLRAHSDAGALVTTPHNPSGLALSREESLRLLVQSEAMNRPLIADEAFIDYVPERSIVREAARSRRAVVLRSLTKFYALAGVRVGYAIAHPDLARAMRERSPSWPVGTLDEAIALEALEDEAYAMRTRAANAATRDAVTRELTTLGLAVFPSDANFVLAELPVPAQAFDAFLRRLIDEGIVVRDCRSYDGLESRSVIRIAVLDRERNRRLVAALARALESLHARRD